MTSLPHGYESKVCVRRGKDTNEIMQKQEIGGGGHGRGEGYLGFVDIVQ